MARTNTSPCLAAVPQPAKLPSRFQVGEAVYVVATVRAVKFGEGQVTYEVIVGSTVEIEMQPNVMVRSYDVIEYAKGQGPVSSEPTIR